jgi:hypothetical protein
MFLSSQEYTEFQVKLMYQYDKMLIELSKKNVSDVFSQWPVELRLLAINIFILVAFILIKTIGNMINPAMVPTLLEALQQFTPILTGENVSTAPGDMSSIFGNMGAQVMRGNNGALNNIVKMFFGGNRAPQQQATYRPRYDE